MPLLSRLYVWSIIFEPLLFFVLFENSTSGVVGNLSRILQMIVLVSLIFKLMLDLSKSAKIHMVNILNPLYSNFSIYFLLIMMAGCIGFVSGAYDIPIEYSYDDSDSGFYQFLSSNTIRPIFEYIVTLYYFIYFVMLPQYFLKTEKDINYFFSSFKIVFIVSFIVGIIDFIFAIFYTSLVPRHIADWRMVGMRFHGLAGEPRDAFVYLFYGLAMLYLYAYFKGVKFNNLWVILIIIAAGLTQSASGLIGILFFLVIYCVYSMSTLNVKVLFQFFILMMPILVLVYLTAIHSDRIMWYIEGTSNLWNILEAGEKLPYQLKVQSSNIYPIYDSIVKLRTLNILPVFIGSGLGSASAINHVYDLTELQINNPHSQFVRVLFESGLLGLFLFIRSFIYPIKFLTKQLSRKTQQKFILLMILLLGVFFGHRSAVGYIYLGIFIATFRVLDGRYSNMKMRENGSLAITRT